MTQINPLELTNFTFPIIHFVCQALLNTGTECTGIDRKNAGMRWNNTGMKRNEQEWYQNIPEQAGMRRNDTQIKRNIAE